MPFCCFEAFWWKFIENFIFRHKTDYLKNEHRNTQKKFLTIFKGANPEEYLDLFKLFLIKPVKWDKY